MGDHAVDKCARQPVLCNILISDVACLYCIVYTQLAPPLHSASLLRRITHAPNVGFCRVLIHQREPLYSPAPPCTTQVGDAGCGWSGVISSGWLIHCRWNDSNPLLHRCWDCWVSGVLHKWKEETQQLSGKQHIHRSTPGLTPLEETMVTSNRVLYISIELPLNKLWWLVTEYCISLLSCL